MGMGKGIALIANMAAEAAAETLWPTRCAICDAPGAVLCERCRRNLPFLDWWRACRRCGSPYGLVQCDLCNPASLARMGVKQLPFASCASAVLFTGDTGQLVRVFKDQGEQRLAPEMARLMIRVVPPDWQIDALTFVPATLVAFRNRGYDHAELLAQSLSGLLGLPCERTLQRPRSRDQRGLSAAGRIRNLSGSFALRQGTLAHGRYLLVDDVFTTGATLCAASQALLASGATEVRCLTFARV